MIELSILKLNANTREPMATAMDSSTVPILVPVACNDELSMLYWMLYEGTNDHCYGL